MFGLLNSFFYSDIVLLEHPISVNTSLNYLCMFCVISTLDLLSASCQGPGMK